MVIGVPCTQFVLTLVIACEQAPKWGIGGNEKSASGASRARYGPPSQIFVFALYPTWEPVPRLPWLWKLNKLRTKESGQVTLCGKWCATGTYDDDERKAGWTKSNLKENDVFIQSMTQANSEKENASTPSRSRT